MCSQAGDSDSEQRLVHAILEGDSSALARLREAHQPSLFKILRARGASIDEVEDLLAGLWADCVPRNDDQPSLLEKFSGRCALQSWLATVATRRWIDLKRRQMRRGECLQTSSEGDESNPPDHLPAAIPPQREEGILGLLSAGLRVAFAACEPEGLLLLRLVYLHGVSQRQLMQVWGWSESKISRHLSQALSHIEQITLEHLRRSDPWLTLTWQDFVDLCETHQLGFL